MPRYEVRVQRYVTLVYELEAENDADIINRFYNRQLGEERMRMEDNRDDELVEYFVV